MGERPLWLERFDQQLKGQGLMLVSIQGGLTCIEKFSQLEKQYKLKQAEMDL